MRTQHSTHTHTPHIQTLYRTHTPHRLCDCASVPSPPLCAIPANVRAPSARAVFLCDRCSQCVLIIRLSGFLSCSSQCVCRYALYSPNVECLSVCIRTCAFRSRIQFALCPKLCANQNERVYARTIGRVPFACPRQTARRTASSTCANVCTLHNLNELTQELCAKYAHSVL